MASFAVKKTLTSVCRRKARPLGLPCAPSELCTLHRLHTPWVLHTMKLCSNVTPVLRPRVRSEGVANFIFVHNMSTAHAATLLGRARILVHHNVAAAFRRCLYCPPALLKCQKLVQRGISVFTNLSKLYIWCKRSNILKNHLSLVFYENVNRLHLQ